MARSRPTQVPVARTKVVRVVRPPVAFMTFSPDRWRHGGICNKYNCLRLHMTSFNGAAVVAIRRLIVLWRSQRNLTLPGSTFILRTWKRARAQEGLESSCRPLASISRCYSGLMTFPRITIRPDQMGGAPCVRGLRIAVSVVVELVAEGLTADEIIALHPDLEREDVPEALRFAAEAVRERELPLASLG